MVPDNSEEEVIRESFEVVETAREQVFWASGIVDCCVYATDSLLVQKNGRPNLQLALEGTHALLEKSAGELMDALDGEAADGGAS